MKPRSWSDLTPEQQRSIVAGGLVELALTLYCLVDLRRRGDDQVRGARRWWVPALFVQPFGPVAYLVFGRRPAEPS